MDITNIAAIISRRRQRGFAPTSQLLLSFSAGQDPGASGWVSLTRAGPARYRDVNGVLQTAGTNITRQAAYFGSQITWLLETNAKTNSALWSEDLTNAAWTKLGATPTTIGGSITAPDGTTNTTCGQIGGNGAFTDQGIQNAAAYVWTDTASQVGQCFGKPGNKSWLMCEHVAKDGTTITRSWFNVTTGAAGTRNHRQLGMFSFQNGFFWCIARLNSALTGASGKTIRWSFVDADNTTTLTGNGATVNGYIWGLQHLQDETIPFWSYVPTTVAAVSRVADASPTHPHSQTPQSKTLYTKLVNLAPGISAGQATFAIGNGAPNLDYFRLLNPNANGEDTFRADVVNNGSQSTAQAGPTAEVVVLDTSYFEARGSCDALFQSTVGAAVNGAAETTNTGAASANPYSGAYSSANYQLAVAGIMAIIRLIDTHGVVTMPTLRTL